MDKINQHKTMKNTRNKRQMKETAEKEVRPKIPKRKKTSYIDFSKSNLLGTHNTEDNLFENRNSNKLVVDNVDKSTTLTNHLKKLAINVSSNEKDKKKIKDQKPRIVNTDDSENSSEEKGSSRKDRKPLPLIFNQSYRHYMDNNYSSSDASEDTKETDYKCVYLGENETLKSFWDKCLYQCFKSKRCVAGEKPKRNYRKKMKTQKPSIKKRKHLGPPLSCIDTKGTAVISKDYLSRYEMLLYMDPLADSMTPWQKKDFEMAFRMVKPSDIFDLDEDNDKSTDYTNSDTD